MQAFISLINENSVETWLLAFASGVLCFVGLTWGMKLLGHRLKRRADRTPTWWDDVVAETVLATHPLITSFLGFYLAGVVLTLPPRLERLLEHGFIIALVLQTGLWGSRAAQCWLSHRSAEERLRGDGASLTNLGIISLICQFTLWLTIILLMLDNLGVNISALVTSLGIGGVAIALALQNILGDLFASLSIALDKPFVAGDFVVVDKEMGTITQVGLKTTRMQSLSGEELVFSNADLLRSRIHNFKRMTERRVLFELGITYGSSSTTLEQAIQIVKSAIDAQALARRDRVHFLRFGDNSLVIEIVYFVLDPDYNRYMDIQQAINLEILRNFTDAGIEFAFPTQTLHIASVPGKLIKA